MCVFVCVWGEGRKIVRVLEAGVKKIITLVVSSREDVFRSQCIYISDMREM